MNRPFLFSLALLLLTMTMKRGELTISELVTAPGSVENCMVSAKAWFPVVPEWTHRVERLRAQMGPNFGPLVKIRRWPAAPMTSRRLVVWGPCACDDVLTPSRPS